MSILEQLFPPTTPQAAPPWPAELPDHLSASQLSVFERCAEQYRQIYVLKKRRPPGLAMLWGTADGRAHAEANFNQKIESHEDVPVTEVKEAFAVILDEEIDKSGGIGELDLREDDDPAKAKDQGVNLVAHYHETVSPRIQPTATEERFSLDIPGCPVPFVGYIDVSTEPYTIERKTARGSSKEIPPQYVLQTLGYALARARPVEMHVSTRTIKPAVYTPQENPGLLLPWVPGLPARAERIIASRARALLALWEQRGPDEPWPDAIGTMAWNTAVCNMCGFRPECSWWEGSTPAPGFGDTFAGVTTTPDDLESERLALTRTLLDIGDKRDRLVTTVAAIDSNHKNRPLAEHVVWLRAQLEKATEAMA